MSLEKFLVDYNEMDIYPMHMPGHKRNEDMMEMVNPYLIDVTEAGELDNLHEPVGVLAESMEKCSKVFGSKSSYFLVNGSTCGILAGICAAVKKGGKVMLSRACHKSVYNGIYLRGAEAVYLYPPLDKAFGVYGSISPRALKMALRRRDDIDLVVLTSPTYEGVTVDIEAMAKICHRYDIPLLVDAAHGAHFGFSPEFPQSAIRQGADIVVESIHKTLPSLTQTSLLHFNSELIDEKKLRQFLAMFQSSSPSYVLMSGIDKCVDYLDSPQTAADFETYTKMLAEFSERMKGLSKFRVLCKGMDTKEQHPFFFGFDPGKIVISTRGSEYTGAELEEILRDRFRIQLEMSLGDYAIAMTGVCDTQEGFDRLAEALLTLDEECDYSKECGQCGDKTICGDSPYCTVNAHVCTNIRYSEALSKEGFRPPRAPRAVLKSGDAIDAAGEAVKVEEALGRVSQEYLYAYPPGVPLIVPGEPVTEEMLGFIRKLEDSETEIHSSLKGWAEGKIFVVTEEALQSLTEEPEEEEEERHEGAGRRIGWFRRREKHPEEEPGTAALESPSAEEDRPLEWSDLPEVDLSKEVWVDVTEEEPETGEQVAMELGTVELIADEHEIKEAEAAEPIAEELETEEFIDEEAAAEVHEAVKLEAGKSEVEEPDDENPVAEEPKAEEPIAEKQEAEEPVVEAIVAEEPTAEELKTEEINIIVEENEEQKEEPAPKGWRKWFRRKKSDKNEESNGELASAETEASASTEFALPDIPEEEWIEVTAGLEEEEIPAPEAPEILEERYEPKAEIPTSVEQEPEADLARDRFERLHRDEPMPEEIKEPEPQERPSVFDNMKTSEPEKTAPMEKADGSAEPEDPRERFERLHEDSPEKGPETDEKRTFWSKLKEFMAIGEEDEFEDLDWEEPLLTEGDDPVTASEEVEREALSRYDTGTDHQYQDLEDLTSEVPDLTEPDQAAPETKSEKTE